MVVVGEKKFWWIWGRVGGKGSIVKEDICIVLWRCVIVINDFFGFLVFCVFVILFKVSKCSVFFEFKVMYFFGLNVWILIIWSLGDNLGLVCEVFCVVVIFFVLLKLIN